MTDFTDTTDIIEPTVQPNLSDDHPDVLGDSGAIVEEKEEVTVASNPPSAAPSEVPSTAEASDLRASVQTEISIKGTIHSYPHKRRKNLKIHMLKSFDGTSYELPRYGKNTSPGIKLEGLDKTAVKVTLRVIPRVNGAIKQITISYLLAVEKLGANEPRN